MKRLTQKRRSKNGSSMAFRYTAVPYAGYTGWWISVEGELRRDEALDNELSRGSSHSPPLATITSHSLATHSHSSGAYIPKKKGRSWLCRGPCV